MIHRLCPLLLVACAAAPRVTMSETWPVQPLPYDTAHQRWTRRAVQTVDFIRLVHAAATLETPEWRISYLHERARRLRISPDEEARLVASERAAPSDAIEVEVLLATAKAEWNDLRKGDRSMWRLSLVGDGGREVTPLEVREDRRPRDEIATYFPDLGPFFQPYIVRFPKVAHDGQPVLAPSTRRLALKIAAPVGAVELVWASD